MVGHQGLCVTEDSVRDLLGGNGSCFLLGNSDGGGWMSWLFLSLLSALFLGIYDLVKKAGVRENAVPPVLFFSVLASAGVWMPFLLWSYGSPDTYPSARFFVEVMSRGEHLLILAKSALVALSWVFNYFAVKNLPLSVASPIRATSPLWTILLAVLLFHERPSPTQWLGMLIVLSGFYVFSFVGKMEGIHFHRDRWVGFMIVATLIGSASALYDKYLLQTRAMDPATVQCWFSIYLAVVLAPLYLYWRSGQMGDDPFEWRWSVPMIGVTLLVADFLYFLALGSPEALISVVSPLRRCAVLITFIGGMVTYKEKNFRPKLGCILVILLGVGLLNW